MCCCARLQCLWQQHHLLMGEGWQPPGVEKLTLGRASSFLLLAAQQMRVRRKEGGGGRRIMDPSNQVVSTDLALDRVAGDLHIQKTIHLA